jgi:rSAM/selenodomain-associated transferase 1
LLGGEGTRVHRQRAKRVIVRGDTPDFLAVEGKRVLRQPEIPMTYDEALILMAKVPRPGRVKTRLSPPLSHAAAASLYACLLSDTAAEMATLVRVRRYLFLDPPGELESLEGPPFQAFERRPQTGKDLGERMARAAVSAFRSGAKAVAIVGADCPSLSAGRVRQAFRELRDGAGAVFGPTTDGGFCLVGLSTAEIRIFRGIPWGTSTVLSDVSSRCRALGMPYALLPPERDVDVYDDLVALQSWMAAHRSPACPRSREWITSGPSSGESVTHDR